MADNKNRNTAIEKVILQKVTFVNGKFDYSAEVARQVQEAFPEIDIIDVVKSCEKWIREKMMKKHLDGQKGYSGQHAKTLFKFIHTKLETGQLLVNSKKVDSAKPPKDEFATVCTLSSASKEMTWLLENEESANLIFTAEFIPDYVEGIYKSLKNYFYYHDNLAIHFPRLPEKLQKLKKYIPVGLEACIALCSEKKAYQVCSENQRCTDPVEIIEVGGEVEYIEPEANCRTKAANWKKELTQADKVLYHQVSQKIVRYDRGLALSELFRQTSQKEPLKFRNDIKPQEFDGFKITLTAPDMGESEQSLLIAYLMIAAQQLQDGKILLEDGCADHKLVQEKVVRRDGSELHNTAAIKKTTCLIQIGTMQLYEVLGVKESGQNRAVYKACHERLCSTTVEIEDMSTGEVCVTSLISGEFGVGRNSINCRLNYILTNILLSVGPTGAGGYVSIQLEEYFELPKGPIRLLYVFLCTWGGNRKNLSIGLDKLIPHIFSRSAVSVSEKTEGEKNRERKSQERQKKQIIKGISLISNLPTFVDKILPVYK